MPEVILNRVQVVNDVALHPHERINVTEAVKATLEKRGALMSEDELQALEDEKTAQTQVFETTDETTPETSHAPAPTKPTAPTAPSAAAPAPAETGGVTITVAPTVAPTTPAKVETTPTK